MNLGEPPAPKVAADQAQPVLITVTETDEDVLRALSEAMESEARCRTLANRAQNALAAARKHTKTASEHAAAHYSNTRQIEMGLTTE